MKVDFNVTVTATDLNSSAENVSWIRICEEDGRIDAVGYPLAAFNIFSILANILHMIILSNMTALKRSSYYHVLMHLSLTDIYYSLFATCGMTLNRMEYFQDVPIFLIMIYTILYKASHSSRYVILAVATAERYSALCRPLQHTSSKFIVYIHIWLPIFWLLNLTWASVGIGLFPEELCFTEFSGPTIGYGPISGPIFVMAWVGSFIIIIIVLQGRVLAELYHLRGANLTREKLAIKRSTKYLVAIIGTFFVCLIPTATALLNRLFDGPSYNTLDYYLGTVLFSSLYGVINVVIYGWMNPSYRYRALVILISILSKK